MVILLTQPETIVIPVEMAATLREMTAATRTTDPTQIPNDPELLAVRVTALDYNVQPS